MRTAAVIAILLATLPAGAALAKGQPKAHPPAAAGKAAGHGATAPGKAPHGPTMLDLASHGNGEAQYQVALATLHSKGQPAKLTAQALVWLGLAAVNGNVPAALEGAQLEEKAGNLAEAAHWWYRAGVLGDQTARARFVDLYLAGRTDNLGGAAGTEWLTQRAKAGDVKAKLALGDALQNGKGVVIDLAAAQRWYLDAALDGDTDAMARLGALQIRLPAVWRAAGKEMRDGKWTGPATYPLQADGMGRDGVHDLGRTKVAAEHGFDAGDLDFYRPGMVEGEDWLIRAARRGDGDAQYTLARAYLDGLDLPPDLFHAVLWLEAAAWQRDPRALVALAQLALDGQGFPGKDPVRAWVCYDLAAGLGASGADAARDKVGKGLNPRQLSRARQIAQDLREIHPD